MAIDHRSAKLKWAPSTAADLKGYYVYMSAQDDQHFVRLMNQPFQETEWIAEPLRLDTKYFFYVTAVDTSGNESSPSPTTLFQFSDSVIDANLKVMEKKDLQVAPSSTVIEFIDGSSFFSSFTIGG